MDASTTLELLRYELRISGDQGSNSRQVEIPIDVDSTVFHHLRVGARFTAAIRAVNSAGASAWSLPSQTTQALVLNLPSTPLDISSHPNDDSSSVSGTTPQRHIRVRVTWRRPSMTGLTDDSSWPLEAYELEEKAVCPCRLDSNETTSSCEEGPVSSSIFRIEIGNATWENGTTVGAGGDQHGASLMVLC